MYPYIRIVCTYRRSDGLSTITYVHNTLTHQSTSMDDAPQGPPSHPCYMESWLVMAQIYTTSTSMSTVPSLCWRHDHREHSNSASRARLLSRQVYEASDIISIRSSVLAVVFDLIWLDLTHHVWLDSTLFDLFWLTVSDWIPLTVFDSIWFSFIPIRFDSCLTNFPRFESHHSSRIPIKRQGVPHWPGCLRNNPTPKLWNITRLWEHNKSCVMYSSHESFYPAS